MEQIDIQIEQTLDKVRPFLQREGGDIEYIGFKDGIVYLRMVGACEGCVYVDADIKDGVEIILMEEVPGVIRCDATGSYPEEVLEAYNNRLQEKKESK
ncbi:MAG: NifU family protein [Bacilli bacterium]|nr:NifU family protein [Bacilli bacterium]